MIYILLYCNSPFKLQHLIRDGRICFTGLIHNSTTDWCSAHSSSEPEQHSSRDTPYLPNGTYSLRSEQKECFATPNQGKLWLGAIMSPTLAKGHQNNQNFVYLNHKLNQESQILGRPNSDKCNVSLLEGKHNAGVIPLVHSTNSSQLVHPTAQTLSWQELSRRLSSNRTSPYVQDPPTVLRRCWEVFPSAGKHSKSPRIIPRLFHSPGWTSV